MAQGETTGACGRGARVAVSGRTKRTPRNGTGGDRVAHSALLDDLLCRRLVFVAGKGGTGKSTLSAALALIAAKSGKRVLGIEVDAKGDLARSLGSEPVGFVPRVVQPNVSVLALHAEEALQEYLKVYLRVPRLTRFTPLARVFDFLASGVPGTKDMLVIGKIAYEERRRERDGSHVWDLIVVDCSSSGHALPQIGAARAMLNVVRGGGIIRSQVSWIDATLSDRRRTVLTVCALPEEMPVTETIELHDDVAVRGNIALGACFLNRVFAVPVGRDETRLAEALRPADGGDDFAVGVGIGARLHAQSIEYGTRLREALDVPVVDVPFTVARSGLATSHAVADSLRALTESGP